MFSMLSALSCGVPDHLITYNGSKLDINSKQNMLDLLISSESQLELCMHKASELGIITKESMVDWSTYMDYKLGTKLVTSLWGRVGQVLLKCR